MKFFPHKIDKVRGKFFYQALIVTMSVLVISFFLFALDGKFLFPAEKKVLAVLDLTTGQLPEHSRDRNENAGRVEQYFVTRRIEIPFHRISRNNEQLDRGTSRVLQKGQKGLREETYLVTLENGVEVARELVQSDLLCMKQDQIVEIGTNTKMSRSGQLLNFKEVFVVTATAYCAGTAECGCPIDSKGRSACTGSYNDGITASGRPAIAGNGTPTKPHIVAVDPKIIPLGSSLYIDGYGFAIAADTGGAIKGKRLDLLLPTHQEALRFGRRQLKVYFLTD
ncbi:MAG: hypothetical protein GX893_00090 [Firmicutes bacterium]|nr:hypothetical protein [Bacillota bacterium]